MVTKRTNKKRIEVTEVDDLKSAARKTIPDTCRNETGKDDMSLKEIIEIIEKCF